MFARAAADQAGQVQPPQVNNAPAADISQIAVQLIQAIGEGAGGQGPHVNQVRQRWHEGRRISAGLLQSASVEMSNGIFYSSMNLTLLHLSQPPNRRLPQPLVWSAVMLCTQGMIQLGQVLAYLQTCEREMPIIEGRP